MLIEEGEMKQNFCYEENGIRLEYEEDSMKGSTFDLQVLE